MSRSASPSQTWPAPYPDLVRLVSLLPSATEIIYALGLGQDLVGVTFECDEPASARAEKTVVVGGRDTSGMSPGEIDSYLRAQFAQGADLYTLHADALAALKPDLILTQDLCRVCALPSGQVDAALDHLGCQADVLSLDPHTLDEVLDSIVAVADSAGVPDRAGELVATLRARIDRVAVKVAGRPRPRVTVVEWTDPPFTAGHWVPDLVIAAGGEPVAASPAAMSVQTTWASIAAARPDVVIAAPCGFHLAGAAEQARTVAEALPECEVWAIDADGIVVRPGPRLVDGIEAIASILHPGAVDAVPGRTALVRPGPAGRRADAG
jgi:iron complex transport system substrate-binding protein